MTTGVIYDALFLEHDTGNHPESPARLKAIMGALDRQGLLTRLEAIAPRIAADQELALGHSEEYIRRVRELSDAGGGHLDPDTVVSRRSYDAACLAAGAAITATYAVLDHAVDDVFVLCRPPGHHALPDGAMGFCIFNNMVIAVRRALERGVGKVLVVDFDLHHGNGTQYAFASDHSVLYFSVHQHPFYPGTGAVPLKPRRIEDGGPVNVPLPTGVGDVGYQAVFDDLLIPVAERFRPNVILVSAGYDGHWLDPLGSMNLTTRGFAVMTGLLQDLAARLCEGRLVLLLEGGYSLPALAASVVATFQVLLGDRAVDPLGGPLAAETDVGKTIEQLKKVYGLG